MNKIIVRLKKLFASNEGATMAEYALALLLIATVTIVAIALLGNSISSMFTSAASSI